MERMTFVDASFLYLETETDLHANAWLGIFEGPAPSPEEFQRLITSKLPSLPRYRQRVRFVPYDVAPPVWVDDRHFLLSYHLRHIALPPPGSDEQLRDLFTTLMAEPLDRNKPLWQMWTVQGLPDGRWGLISKLHHCMADGAATTDMLTVLLDREPTAAVEVTEDPWEPEPEPTEEQLLQEAVAEANVTIADHVQRYATVMNTIRERMADVDRAFSSLSSSLSNPPSITSLNGPIGPYRRWSWAQASLADVRIVRDAFGGTVNDVVLAMAARAFRDLLMSRGEVVADKTVRTMVPVSVRAADEQGGNRVSSMYAELPVGIEDAAERLADIRAQLDGLKESQQALAGDVLTSMAGFQPPALLAMSARAASRNPTNVNTVTTNVPGPQYPLYALGREMLEDHPYIALASDITLSTTVFSYNGVLRFGVTGDYETTPDIEVFTRGLRNGLEELLKAARNRSGQKPAKARAAKGPRKRAPRRAGKERETPSS